MEMFVWVITGVFLVVMVTSMVRARHVTHQFERYLKENHRQHWDRIYQDQLIGKALLWPFMRGTPVDFAWKSSENFGDPKITDLRRKLKGNIISMFVSMIAVGGWFLIASLVLSSLYKK